MGKSKTSKKFKDPKHREKILDRIQKLLNVASGTKFEAEADTAMKMAQSYMSSYNLSMTDVQLGKELDDKIVKELLTEHANRQNPELWERILCAAVVEIFDCQAIRNHTYYGESKMCFVGYKNDVAMAKVVFTSLYVAIRATAVKKYPPILKELQRQVINFRLSFLYGASSRIFERATKEKQHAMKEPSGRFELVVVEKSKRVEKWTEENMNLKQGKSANPSINPEAYKAGEKHADTMDLMNRDKVKQGETLQIGHQKKK